MGSIIAVHRKVAPEPIESKYEAHQETNEYESETTTLEFVLCAHDIAALGITTLTITSKDILQQTRLVIESLAKKHSHLIQDGRFLFLLPDDTLCQRGWEYDYKTYNAGWKRAGGLRLVVVSDRPPEKNKNNQPEEEEKPTPKIIYSDLASTPSSPPSIMGRPLLTPSGSNTHTLTGGGSEILRALKEEESVLRHQEALQHINDEFQKEKELAYELETKRKQEMSYTNPQHVLELVQHFQSILHPYDTSKEIAWRAIHFHGGTRQWYLDRFDTWCRFYHNNTNDETEQANTSISSTPPIGILRASAGSGKTCLVCRLSQIRPYDVVALHLCKHDDITTTAPKQIVRNLSYQIVSAASKILLGQTGENGGDPSWPTLGRYMDALNREINSLRKCDLDSDSLCLKELFLRLIVSPLLSTSAPIDGRKRVLVVDGIDLCPVLLQCILDCAESLPKWIGIFVTTRTECKHIEHILLNCGNESNSKVEQDEQDEDEKIEDEADEKVEDLHTTVAMLGFAIELNAMDVRVVLRHALRNSPMYGKAGGESVATTSTVLTRSVAAREEKIQEENNNEINDTENNSSPLDLGGGSSVVEATDALLDEAVAILWSKSEDSMLVCSFMIEKIRRPSSETSSKSNTVTNESVWKNEDDTKGKSPGTIWLRELMEYPSRLHEWYTVTLCELLDLDNDDAEIAAKKKEIEDKEKQIAERKEKIVESKINSKTNSISKSISIKPSATIEALSSEQKQPPQLQSRQLTPTLRCLHLLAVAREPLHVQAVESMLKCTINERKILSARLSYLFPIHNKRMHSVHRGFTEWLMGETDANGNEQKDDDNNTDDDQAIGIKVEELPFERSFKRMELEIQITSLCLHLLETATESSLIEICKNYALDALKREKEKAEKDKARAKLVAKRKKDKANGIDWKKKEKEKRTVIAAAGGTPNQKEQEEEDDEDVPLVWRNEAHFYALRHLHPCLLIQNRITEARSLALNFQWMLARAVEGPAFAVVEALEGVLIAEGVKSSKMSASNSRLEGTTDEAVELIASALRLSLGSIYVDPWQLPSQLVGRLLGHAAAAKEIALLLQGARSFSGRLPRKLCTQHEKVSEKEPLKGSAVGEGLEGGWWCPVSSSLKTPGGPLLCTLTGHAGGINSVAWCPGNNNGNMIVSVGRDGQTRLWNLDSGPNSRLLITDEGNAKNINEMNGSGINGNDMNGNGMIDSGANGNDSTIAIHGNNNQKINITDNKTMRATCFSPDGLWIATACDNGIINIWNATSGRCVNRLIGHRDAVVDVQWSADGQKILTGSSDWKVRMWWPNIHGNVTAKQEEEQEEQREQLVESKKEEEKKENNDNDDYNEWSEDDSYEETEEEAREELLYQIQEAKREYRMQKGLKVPVSMQQAYKAAWKDLVLQEKNLSKTFEKKREKAGQKLLDEQHAMEQLRLKKLAATQDTDAMGKIPWGEANMFFDHIELDGHEWKVSNCCFLSTDGEIVASSGDDETLRIYDIHLNTTSNGTDITNTNNINKKQVSTFTVRHVLWGHSGTVRVCEGSPDGEILVSGGGDHEIRIWNVDNGKCLQVLKKHTGVIMALQFDLNGSRLLSSGWENVVYLWDTKTWEILLTLPTIENQGAVLSFAWAPGAEPDRLITGSLDTTLKCWDLPVLFRQEKERLKILSFDASNNETTMTLNELKEWNNKKQKAQLQTKMEHNQSKQVIITDVKWSPDGNRICTTSKDWTSRIWSSFNGRCLFVLSGHTGSALTIGARTEDGTPLLTKVPDSRWIWNADTETFEREMEGHSGAVSVCEWSNDGTFLATASVDGTLRLWDSATGKCLNILRGHKSWIGCVSFSPDGSGVVSGSADRTLRVYLTNTPLVIRSETDVNEQDDSVCCLKGHLGVITDVHWCPEGNARVASASTDWSVRVWDLELNQCTHILDGHGGTVNALSWSFDGRRIGSGSSDHTVRVWRIYKRKFECTDILHGHNSIIKSIGFSSNGNMVVSGAEYVNGGGGGVGDVDGNGTQNGSVIVWKTLTRKEKIEEEKKKEKEIQAKERERKEKEEKEKIVGNTELAKHVTEVKVVNEIDEVGNKCILDIGTSMSRRYRADFIHLQNRNPIEIIQKNDPTIGFSVNDKKDTDITETGLKICPSNPRRAFALSSNMKTIHVLKRIGGSGMCVDCTY